MIQYKVASYVLNLSKPIFVLSSATKPYPKYKKGLWKEAWVASRIRELLSRIGKHVPKLLSGFCLPKGHFTFSSSQSRNVGCKKKPDGNCSLLLFKIMSKGVVSSRVTDEFAKKVFCRTAPCRKLQTLTIKAT